MADSTRGFVLHHTRLRPVPGLEELRLHLADEALVIWHQAQLETGDPDTPMTYWAFAWGGGLAIGRYLRDHPEAVAGKRVFDLASGSGLCAIAAMLAGAESAVAADIDPFSKAAIGLNAKANGCRVSVVRRDVLDDEPPDADVILAGDCHYEASLAERALPWLRRAQAAGIDVLIGDPGRRYLPTDELEELAAYDVRTTTELEDLERKQGRVYRLQPAGVSPG
ncbi:MAG TPA: 50S ribosomal protein L11 methyltransferase [Candidatus Limnocylindrales bacterium]|jgi:predicted nicotinamide N-methyase